MRTRKPVSRIDSNNTHGWFARVYRDTWVGSRSFADRRYGSREKAEAAAWKWVKIANERLPQIPPKPVLKVAKFKLRIDQKGRYYDVYLPKPGRKTKPQSRKYQFQKIESMDRQAERANKLVKTRNVQLVAEYELASVLWRRKRDRIMSRILEIWKEVKTIPIP